MIVAIFALASLLLALAAFALVAAINLVPTDFGFTYAHVAAVLLGAGIVTVAIGLAARTLHRQLQRMAVALEDNLRVAQNQPETQLGMPSVPVQEPVLAPESQNAGDGTSHGAGLGTVAAIGAAGLATGALVAGAHHSIKNADPLHSSLETLPDAVPATVNDRIMEELESDLFALTPAAVAADAIAPDVHMPEAHVPESVRADEPPEPVTAEIATADAISATPLAAAEEALISIQASKFGEDLAVNHHLETLQVDIPQVDIPQVDIPQIDPPLEVPPAPSVPAGWPLPPEPEAIVMPGAEPVEPVVEPVPAPQPGLIADADLAALAEEILPPLAPVSTLEVVGAYDSGGTRFTMYSDGSVTAAGPEGETRFRTLDDLRRHLGTHQG